MPKQDKSDKNDYILMAAPNVSLTISSGLQVYQVISIDPATDNFAFRIERRWTDPLNPKYCSKIETIAFERRKFRRNVENNICNLYGDINEFLDQYHNDYLDSNLIIIERQMADNPKAYRVGQHVISYFLNKLTNHPLNAILVELSPKVKGKALHAPSGMNKNALKKWSIAIALQFLEIRCDYTGINKMKSYGKKLDDLADTIIQIEALFTNWGLPLTPPKPTIHIQEQSSSQTFYLDISSNIIIPQYA